MNDKEQLVCVLPNGIEIDVEVPIENPCRKKFADVAKKAVRLSGLKQKRNEETKIIRVSVYRLAIKKREIVYALQGTYNVPLPLAIMTDDDYNFDMNELLKQIPQEFHGFVRWQAWDRGHSSGREECYSIAYDLVDKLKPAIFLLKRNIENEISRATLSGPTS